MKFLALIPARGGSKRIPNKNIRVLGGKPLINWSIETASEVESIVDIVVSTDSAEIAEIARAAGALVPWLRPAELATDDSSSIGVCIHALDWYIKEKGQVDGLILLQPTSPFRSAQTINRGITLFQQFEHRPVVSFSGANSHPMWCYRVIENSIIPFIKDAHSIRSQDLPPAYTINGALYIASPAYLRTNASFFGNETVPMIMEDPYEMIDIDTEWDWSIAECLVKNRA